MRSINPSCYFIVLLPCPILSQEAGNRKLAAEEVDKLEMMHKYVLSNAHFYCETVDISRPFPSSRPVDKPSWEFVWNRWLSASLRAVGLHKHCPNLIQVCCRTVLPWSPALQTYMPAAL